MGLDIEDGIELIIQAREKTEESKSWSMWVSLYPNMTKETFIPFSEFYSSQKYPRFISTEDKKTTEDLYKEIKDMEKLFN